MKCLRCGRRETFYTKPYSGEGLCSQCLIKDVIMRVKRTISHFKMYNPLDRILLVVKPTYKGLALIDIMSKIEVEFPQVSLILLILKSAKESTMIRHEARRLGLKMIEESIEEFLGMPIDDLGKRLKMKGYDSSFLEYIVESAESLLAQKKAKELSATKISLCKSLEDEVLRILSLMMNGMIPTLSIVPNARSYHELNLIPLTAPLIFIPDMELMYYLKARGLNYPPSHLTSRSIMKALMKELERRYPSMGFSLIRIAEKMMQLLAERVKPCMICGLPTEEEICIGCQASMKIGLPGWQATP